MQNHQNKLHLFTNDVIQKYEYMYNLVDERVKNNSKSPRLYGKILFRYLMITHEALNDSKLQKLHTNLT